VTELGGPTFCETRAVGYQVKMTGTLWNYVRYTLTCGPGSSVGIATDYGLDGPGSNPGGDEIFRLFRPALESTQLPVQWVPGLSWG